MKILEKLISLLIVITLINMFSLTTFATISPHEDEGEEEILMESVNEESITESEESSEFESNVDSQTESESDESSNLNSSVSNNESDVESDTKSDVETENEVESNSQSIAESEIQNESDIYNVDDKEEVQTGNNLIDENKTEKSENNKIFKVLGIILILVGIIGLASIVVWIVMTKKPEDEQRKEDIYRAINASKAKDAPMKTKNISVPSNLPSKKTSTAKVNVKKYDTDEILNEVLNNSER